MKRFTKCLAVLLITVLVSAGFCGCGKDEAANTEETTITFLSLWQGESSKAPADELNNVVAQAIRKATGVNIELQFNTVSEVEKLNILFASDSLPDVISAPFWGGSDSSTLLIKKGAREGMLYPLNELFEKYDEKIKDSYNFLTNDIKEFDFEDPSFNGEHYMIPTQVPATVDDISNNGLTLYIRGDIAEELNLDVNTIETSEDVYELLKKIKAGNFKDANGSEIIPAGTWHSGLYADQFATSYISMKQNQTGYFKDGDKVVDDIFNPLLDKQVLFFRKLISEGLFDVEALSQNSARAKEKMAVGKVAVVPSTYYNMQSNLTNTLYATNPEMKYIPLPHLKDADGVRGKYVLGGSGGCPVLFIAKNSKKADAVMKVLEYLNSDEGMLLISYGIEGTHYEMVDGQPRFKEEWLNKLKNDTKALSKEGIRGIYDRFMIYDYRLSRYGESSPGESANPDPDRELAKERSPIVGYLNGFRVNFYENSYSEIDAIRTMKPNAKIFDAINRAKYAESDERALEILNEFREQLRDGGIQELFDHITELAKDREDLIF